MTSVATNKYETCTISTNIVNIIVPTEGLLANYFYELVLTSKLADTTLNSGYYYLDYKGFIFNSTLMANGF